MCLSQVSGRKLAARDLPGAWERHRAGRTELRPVGSRGPPDGRSFIPSKKLYLYNVRPPRYLSWFITPITMVGVPPDQ